MQPATYGDIVPPAELLDREIAAIVELSLRVPDRRTFRSEALRRLRAMIAFDRGIFSSREPEMPVTLDARHDRREQFVRNFAHYVDELRPIERAALAAGGVIVDAQVFTPRQRDRMRFYAEIVRPQGLGTLLAGYLTFRGSASAALYLAREGTKRPFRRDECDRFRAVLPVLSLGDAAHASSAKDTPATTTATEVVDWSLLSARERDLVEYAALGLRNQDIALACGVSANTVRNQLASVYAKMCVANRTELTRLAVSSGLATVSSRAAK